MTGFFNEPDENILSRVNSGRNEAGRSKSPHTGNEKGGLIPGRSGVTLPHFLEAGARRGLNVSFHLRISLKNP